MPISGPELTKRLNRIARTYGLKRRRNESDSALMCRIDNKMPFDERRRVSDAFGRNLKEVMDTDPWMDKWKR